MLYNYDSLLFQVFSITHLTWEAAHHVVLPRSYSALAYRVRGSGQFTIGDQHFTANEGDILYLPAGIGYEVDYTDGEIIVIHFSYCNYDSQPENYAFSNTDHFYHLFQNILQAWEQQTSIYEINAMVYQLLNTMRHSKTHGAVQDEALSLCLALLNTHFANPNLSISNICHTAGISEPTLRRKFQSIFNTSPKQYLLNLRLTKAIKLLGENDYNITEIAERCGFSDTKYFSRMIKKKFNLSPRTLRQKLKM